MSTDNVLAQTLQYVSIVITDGSVCYDEYGSGWLYNKICVDTMTVKESTCQVCPTFLCFLLFEQFLPIVLPWKNYVKHFYISGHLIVPTIIRVRILSTLVWFFLAWTCKFVIGLSDSEVPSFSPGGTGWSVSVFVCPSVRAWIAHVISTVSQRLECQSSSELGYTVNYYHFKTSLSQKVRSIPAQKKHWPNGDPMGSAFFPITGTLLLIVSLMGFLTSWSWCRFYEKARSLCMGTNAP